MLIANGLSVGYGRKMVLHGVDFIAGEAQVISLIGPNGSGKSTLLRSLCGLIPASKGSVRIYNEPLTGMGVREISRCIAFLPQVHERMHDVSMYELISMGRAPYHTSGWIKSKQDVEKIQWAIEYMSLEPLVHRQMDQLSGGEQQRAWIAMILAQDTPIILLDEPVTYMDLRFQCELLNTIRDLRDTCRKTVVSVFHDINHALEVSDYLYLLKDGCIYSQGTSEQVITEHTISEVYGIHAHVCRFHGCRRNVVVPASGVDATVFRPQGTCVMEVT